MRRFTRLTNAFSKKLDDLRHSVLLHYYHFARNHKTLRVSPAQAAGITDKALGDRRYCSIAGLTLCLIASARDEGTVY